jgi:hypothetical protein
MPYGQSPWEDAAASIRGVGENMNNVAFRVAQLKYQRAAQEQRLAIAMAHQVMQGQMQQSLQEKNTALSKAADARTALDRIRASTGQRQQAVAGQLGGEEFAHAMPDVSNINIGDKNTDWQAIGQQANMAKIRSALMESRALAGKSSDPYAQHNIPEGGTSVDMGGNIIGVGQPKPERPFMHNATPGTVVLGADGKPITSIPDRPTRASVVNPGPIYDSLVRYSGGFDAPPHFLETNDLARVAHDLTMADLQRQLQARTSTAQLAPAPDSAPALTAPVNPPPSRVSPAGNAPKVIKDAQGKSWVYKGSHPDPTQDRDENNWEEVGNATP